MDEQSLQSEEEFLSLSEDNYLEDAAEVQLPYYHPRRRLRPPLFPFFPFFPFFPYPPYPYPYYRPYPPYPYYPY
ncbi:MULTISPECIES: hypothetical protein [Bacillaceae]|uniref:hypothetical protein n=1 Tax=Bacillaceae TaxID=186817 RepID=UPI00039A3CC7|nr:MULTISPECIES: hypothetical protein [Bacillaceae]